MFLLWAVKALLISASLQPLHLGQTITASREGQTLLLLQEEDPIAVIALHAGATLTWHGKEPAELLGDAHLWLKQPIAFSIQNQPVTFQSGEFCLRDSKTADCDADETSTETAYFAALPPLNLDAPERAPRGAELSEQAASEGAAVEQSACLDGGDSGEASSVDQQETSDFNNQDVQLRIEVRFP